VRRCPAVARLLGWTLLSIDPERGEIRVRFEAKPDFLNPAGTVQGGILSAMLDDTTNAGRGTSDEAF
jgi:acyl-coenzyme A thioesterase PaaI-like protein